MRKKQELSIPIPESGKKSVRNRQRLTAIWVLLSLAMGFFVTYELRMPAWTLAGDADCGYTEHVHTDACVERVLICGQEEGEPDRDHPGQKHRHTESCYGLSYTCGFPADYEHVHTSECFADQTADVEQPADWEREVKAVPLTEHPAADLLAVARTQLGYEESRKNWQADAHHVKQGYTRYGAKNGTPYAPWSALFLSFCLEYAKIPEQTVFACSDCASWVLNLKQKNRFCPVYDHTPRAGDLAFLDGNGDGKADRAAIVSRADRQEMTLIEGDVEGKVTEHSLSLPHGSVLGFCRLPEQRTLAVLGEAGVETQFLLPERTAKFAMPLSQLRAIPPLDVAPYVPSKDAIQVFYQPEGQSDWIEIHGTAVLKGNEKIRLKVRYDSVPINRLKAADYTMTYTLPEGLQDANANGLITDAAHNPIGTIRSKNRKITISFDPNWLDHQIGDTVRGDFFVEAKLDLKTIIDHYPGGVTIGNATIDLENREDAISKYGKVTLEKERPQLVTEANGSTYLEYVLRVRAGDDGAPDVKVWDTFTKGKEHVAAYAGVTGRLAPLSSSETASPREECNIKSFQRGSVCIGTLKNGVVQEAGSSFAAPGNLVWVVGDMAPLEVRTLTYRVKLTDRYLSMPSRPGLQNSAKVFSKEFERHGAAAEYAPVGKVRLSKSSHTRKELDGSYTIFYTLIARADPKNSYMITDLVIRDQLNSSTKGALPYLSYDEHSFRLYEDDKPKDPLPISPKMNSDRKGFEAKIGVLAPGESKKLTYSVKLSPAAFAAMGDADFMVRNKAQLLHQNQENQRYEQLARAERKVTVDRKQWARKIAGDVVGEKLDVPFGRHNGVYEVREDGSVHPKMQTGASFPVPKGSYTYRVVVNESGDWNVSSAMFKDNIKGPQMNFVGYAKVEAFRIGSKNAPLPTDSDDVVLQKMDHLTPDRTAWVEINGKSFGFKAKEIGMEGQYAYRLTYYAQPVQMTDLTQVMVGNDFTVSGDVGIGELEFINVNVTVSADVKVFGGNGFTANKQSWYYEPESGQNEAPAGFIYWLVKVEGTVIPKGTCFKDVIDDRKGSPHHLGPNSICQVFLAAAADETGPISFERFSKMPPGSYELLQPSAYQISCAAKQAEICFAQDLNIPAGKALYFLIRTAPEQKPVGDRNFNQYYNSLYSKSPGSDQLEFHNQANRILSSSDNLFKELHSIFTYDGKTLVYLQEALKNSRIDKKLLQGVPGTYVAWKVRINYEGELKGTYRVEEQLPEGMEPVYMKIKWRGAQAAQTEAVPIEGLDASWKKHEIVSPTDNGVSTKSIFYEKGQLLQMQIAGFQDGRSISQCAVDLQVVCRLRDPDALLGDVKTFVNHVRLYDEEHNRVGIGESRVEMHHQTVKKRGLYDAEVDGSHYHFVIDVNPVGEDLSPYEDTVTLVDDFGPKLKLRPDSISVCLTKDPDTKIPVQPVLENTPQGERLKIKLPDNLPLTVAYEVIVDALPGEKVDFTNIAYWEGHNGPGRSELEVKDFQYTAGGSAGTAGKARLEIVKWDRDNLTKRLPGARFSVTACAVEGNRLRPLPETEREGVTDADGVLRFEVEIGTVYRIQEIQAPEGYVLDQQPHHFVMLSSAMTTRKFPPNVTVYGDSAVYTYAAYNHRGEISIVKRFTDQKGNQTPVDGIYRFGLFETADGSGKPLETVTVTVKNQEVSAGKFLNLTLGNTYFVYELNQKGTPIRQEGTIVVGQDVFRVHYQNGTSEVLIPAGGTVEFQVTNERTVFILPETGGSGVQTCLALGGALLLFSALGLLLHQRKKKRH